MGKLEAAKSRAEKTAASVRVDGWTEPRRRLFLERLAACASVDAAARAAGMTTSGLYPLRQRDPEFAAQWEAARETGYLALEAMLVERAARTLVTDDPAKLDTELAMRLLGMRDRRPGAKPGNPRRLKTVSVEALNQSIIAKLDVLERRERAKQARLQKEAVAVLPAKRDTAE